MKSIKQEKIDQPNLQIIIKNFFDHYGWISSNIEREKESQEYEAYRLKINEKTVVFRTAKTTPTKVGQFVTLWKRNNGEAPIQPFSSEDSIDYVIVCTRQEERLGLFIFNNIVLQQKGIYSTENQKGKLAIRVYPVWDNPTSYQAQKTQAWQKEYFSEILAQEPQTKEKIKTLFKNNY
jgi:hypothetical protein